MAVKGQLSALVIGGGIIGLASAVRLGEAGAATTLIDPEPNPRGASWGNAGHIAVEQTAPLASPGMVLGAAARLFPRGALALPVRDVAAWAPFVWRLLRASRQARFAAGQAALSALLADAMPAWRRLAGDIAAPDLLREDGHFIVWESPETAAGGRARWRAADIGAATIRDASTEELATLSALAAVPIAGAIRFAGSGQIVDLGDLADRLAARFAALGGQRIAARIDRLERDGATVRAIVDGRRIAADRILLAAGAASGALLRTIGIASPLIAERGYHIQAADHRWPADLPPVVFEDRSMIVTRFRSGLRAAGFVEFAKAGSPPDPSKWTMLRAHVAALGLPFGSPTSEWIGARPTLPDYLPAIGRLAGTNLIAAFGHQHLGLTLAPITAELVRDLVLDRRPAIDLVPFDPARFTARDRSP